MRIEYLAFDLFVLAPVIAMRVLRPRALAGFFGPALRSVALAALPFTAWDVAVVGRHWWFHEDRVLPIRIAGLPLEEIGFFVVVPLACLMLWELVLRPSVARMNATLGHFSLPLLLAFVAVAVWSTVTGREYTALSSAAMGVAIIIDGALGTRLLAMKRGWLYVLSVAALTTLFNGYLTGRPIVLYDETYQVPFRVITVPIEDYGFGLSLIVLATSLYQSARGRTVAPSLAGRFIEWRLGGYRRRVHRPDERLPLAVPSPRTVAIIGGGLAGLSAAELLSRRGFQVTLFERQPYLGGKIASWLEDGHEIEHGFHAFFRHYFNLLEWLEALDVRQQLVPIDDYLLLARDGARFSFRGIETTPALNLLSLQAKGLFRWREVMSQRTGTALQKFMEYDPAKTPRLDDQSFRDFAQSAALPPKLKLVFTMFSRAFFADDHRISMAALVKSFHFYFLSHDRGLMFEHLTAPTRHVLIDPLAQRLVARGTKIHLGTTVETLEHTREGFRVDGAPFDAVVLAGDVRSTQQLLARSPSVADATPALSAIGQLRSGQRYAVLRVWCDGPVGGDALPAFVSTERAPALDAFAFAHRVGAETSRGAVLELHCYAVPDEVTSEQLPAILEQELAAYLPGFTSARVTRRHLQVRDDFTAFHVGQLAHRPGVVSGLAGLVFAGDWVELPFPAMLMEAAHTSALLAANELCRLAGARTYEVWSVPPKGLLA